MVLDGQEVLKNGTMRGAGQWIKLGWNDKVCIDLPKEPLMQPKCLSRSLVQYFVATIGENITDRHRMKSSWSIHLDVFYIVEAGDLVLSFKHVRFGDQQRLSCQTIGGEINASCSTASVRNLYKQTFSCTWKLCRRQ
jgi:hypothetical protein